MAKIDETIARLRELMEKATSLPWSIYYDNDTGPGDEGYWEWWSVAQAKVDDEDDANFIAAAANSIPELIDEIERLRRGDFTEE